MLIKGFKYMHAVREILACKMMIVDIRRKVRGAVRRYCRMVGSDVDFTAQLGYSILTFISDWIV